MASRSSSTTVRRLSFSRLIIGLILLSGLLPCFDGVSRAAGPAANPAQDLLSFVSRAIEWYRRINAFDQDPVSTQEVVYRDTVSQTARQSLQLVFDFAKRDAELLSTTHISTTAPAGSQTDRLAAAAAAAVQRVLAIQTQIDQIDQEMLSNATSRPILSARRDKLVSQLALAKARQQVLQNLSGFTTEGTGGTLSQQIADLEKSVPEARLSDDQNATTQPAIPEASTAQQPTRIESLGIVGLVEEMFSLTRKLSDIDSLAKQTERLHEEAEQKRGPIRADILDAIHRGDALSAQHDSDDPKTLASQRQELDALTARFKLVSAAAVPLSEDNTVLKATYNSLLDWHGAVMDRYHQALRSLLIRIGAMMGAILVLLVISKLWRTATFRYVTDIRRRRQFLLVRRLVVGGIVILIIVGGFVTEFGSLATYAGLLTAGIAVALQSVILSGVAHFFFLGRYGVRVGDRVTISGITGDVIDIGIFRLYMMELGGKNGDFQPTGRIVIFSNSVLFQPNAFYKQIPGAEYNWHEVGLTLSPDSDYHLAETKLLAAVELVYSEYSKDIEAQHERAAEELHLQLATPKPEGRLRLVESGLEFVVRYPVEVRRASEIDDKVTRKLLTTIENEPKLKLVATSTPRIQPAVPA